MKVVTGNRASQILYNWLLDNNMDTKVLIAANICETVPCTYLKAGLKIEFSDINLSTYNMDREKIVKFVKKNPNAIVHYSHTYGKRDNDINVFFENIKSDSNCKIVDDCCLCIPQFNFCDSSCIDLQLYSTGHVKPVDIGYGGFAYVNDKWKYENSTYKYSIDDFNHFSNDIKVCQQKLKRPNELTINYNWLDPKIKFNNKDYFDKIKEQYQKVLIHKQNINKIYSKIPGSMANEFNNWRYNIMVKNQSECIDALFNENLFCSKHYVSLCNGYFSKSKTENCDYLYSHVVNLFNDFYYTDEQALKTANILKSVAIPV